MIEFIAVALIVSLAALYWYKRLFPASWNRTRLRLGLAPKQIANSKGKGCDGCSIGCKGGGCH
ncbi:hypothetical protein [Kozakia baliensis]|uniref:hypothetical protein n=1 Tax=Kozakia baliensis TaxID=153496 RepID=UPI000497C932|nr:hypothetical protein [Kozakia baliensis]